MYSFPSKFSYVYSASYINSLSASVFNSSLSSSCDVPALLNVLGFSLVPPSTEISTSFPNVTTGLI